MSGSQTRAEVAGRLRGRFEEVEDAVMTRVRAIGDPTGGLDPTYADGLHAAVSAAITYVIDMIEHGDRQAESPPSALLNQARAAARNGVGLDTVLRRLVAGFTVLGEFVALETEGRGGNDPALAHRLAAGLAVLLDQLLAATSEEYLHERGLRTASTEKRRVERIERLLGGEAADTSDINYDFDSRHLGLVAAGPDAEREVRAMLAGLDGRCLLVRQGPDVVWAWAGTRRPVDPDELRRPMQHLPARNLVASFGEPNEGIAGWRLTHRQAAAAFRVARRGSFAFVRYREVALLAAGLSDDLLATSLKRLYVAPLNRQRDEGEAARETLLAYFASSCNVSSTAALMGVNRRTVTKRLKAIETAIGLRVSDASPDIEAAIKLDALDRGEPYAR